MVSEGRGRIREARQEAVEEESKEASSGRDSRGRIEGPPPESGEVAAYSARNVAPGSYFGKLIPDGPPGDAPGATSITVTSGRAQNRTRGIRAPSMPMPRLT